MPDTKSETIKNLEKQLLKNGKAACPNPDCTQSIITEESQGRAGSNILEYWCPNETCDYHKKRVINISIGKGWIEEIKSAFSNLGKKAIAGVVGIFLVIGATLGNYVPKLLGISDTPDEKTEEILEENRKLQERVKTLLEENKPEDNASTSVNSEKKDKKVDLLEKQVDALNNKLKQQFRYVPHGMLISAQNRIKNGDTDNAKKVFEDIYSNTKIKEFILSPENNRLKKDFVETIAESYSVDQNQFTTKYFKDSSSFQFFLSFLETFKVDSKYDIYLGQAYYSFPNKMTGLRSKESKRYQLMSLKHYLLAANDGRFSDGIPQYIATEINAVLILYKPFPVHQYKEGQSEHPVILKIKEKDENFIVKRINELQKVIDMLSM